MGCGGSRSAANNASGAAAPKPQNKLLGPSDKGRAESATVSISGVDVRGNSANSQRSSDSGIGSQHGNGSPLAKTEKIMEDLKKVSLLEGHRPPERVDETKILNSLRDEGLINAPETKTASSGVKFEIKLDGGAAVDHPIRKPPARLQKLDRAEQMNLTRERIKAKLEKAEEARKKRDELRVQKQTQRDLKNSLIRGQLVELEKQKEAEISGNLSDKLDKTLEKRDLQLISKRSKLKSLDQKAEEVRSRKAHSTPLPPTTADPKELDMMTPHPAPKNLDDLPVAAALHKK